MSLNQQNTINVQSPTRVDLAGGTLDLWPLYNFVSEAETINIAIDIWTKVSLIPHDSEEIFLESLDLKKTWTFKNIIELLKSSESYIDLYQKVIEKFYFQRPNSFKKGFKLVTQSQSPIGGGLGGSSSLIISMMKVLSQWSGYQFKNSHEMVQWSHNIEAQILNTPTGTQDYYPAISGGLNFLKYNTFGIQQKVENPLQSPLYSHFLLVYTGRSHHSGLNNFEVLKAAIAKDENVMRALCKIKDIAVKMKNALHNQNWASLPELFKQEYAARIQLTPAFTSPEIERLHQICLSNGAEAVKICGAGGGGCVLVWVAPEHRQKVIEACEKENFQCLSAKPVNPTNLFDS